MQKISFKNSFKWSFLTECICNIILPLAAIINANLLEPEDIGILTAASIIISFSQDIWSSGLSKSLIQANERFDEHAQVTYWINFSLGFLISFSLFIFSDSIAEIFKEERLGSVLKILSVLVFMTSLSSVYVAIMQKNMMFKKLFWIRILTVAIPACVSIPLAMSGYSYWALVYGLLIGQLIQFFFIIYFSNWKPKIFFDKTLCGRIFQFGRWVMLTNLAGWFYTKVDIMIVGIYYTVHELGIYGNGSKMPTMIYAVFFRALIPVIYSIYSQLNSRGEDLKSLHLLVIKLTSMIAMPIGFGLFAISDQIEKVVFKPQWAGLSEVLAYIGLAYAFSWLVSINGELFKAIGKPEVETKVVYSVILIYFFAYMATIQYDFQIFLQARFALTFVGMTVNILFLKKYFGINFTQWLTQCYKPILCSVVMCVLIVIIKKYFEPNYLSLLFFVILGAVIYLGLLFVFEKQFLKYEVKKLLNLKFDLK